jgi:NADH-quinone oxidoreductase subunit L
VRQFGGLRKILPVTHITFLCGAAALAGIPLLSGFWSKDEILAVLHEAAEHETYGSSFAVIYWIATITAALTAFYTFRAYFMTLWGPERFPAEAGHHPHDAPPVMAWPLRVLAIAALLVGLAAGATHWFANYLEHTPGFEHEGEHVFHLDLMVLSGVVALGGIAAAWWVYVRRPAFASRLADRANFLYDLSSKKFFIDEILTALVVAPMRIVARIFYLIDVFIIDRIVDAVGVLTRRDRAGPRLVPYRFV